MGRSRAHPREGGSAEPRTLGPVTDRLGRLLRSRLDSWRGIGDVERGMARQGFDLQLTRYDARGWRATFYTTAMEHSITSATASAWEPTPWHATQRAAWDALRKAGAAEGEPYG